MKIGSAEERSVSSHVPDPLRSAVFVTDGCQSIFAPQAARVAFSPGWSRMNAKAFRW